MKAEYNCPYCNAYLLLKKYLVLSARHNGDPAMLLFMNPELGNTQAVYHPNMQVRLGERYDFYCPVCHETLTSELHENLVMVKMTDEAGKSYELHFSRIAGQKCTYKIMGNIFEFFGNDAQHYLDMIGLINMT
ncbi:MAG: hypothetical protein KGZ82_06660 [Bacteroidales bacterium]|nr:hypothetical protein [Bacteroidales bacterium]